MFDPMFIAFGLYCFILFSIGIFFYAKNTNQASFSLGNRSLNYWLTAIAAQASDMSDWLFMGFPGLIYAVGFSGAWFAFGLALFMFLTWQFIAPKLREQTEQYQAVTLTDFFAKKVLDRSNYIKMVSGFLCLYFFTFYIAAGIVGIGKAFEIIFEIPYHQGIFIGLIMSLTYTALGGLLAVAWSNLLQGTFLLACIMFVPIYVTITKLNGFTHAYNSLKLFGTEFNSFWPTSGIIGTIMAILKWGPGYFGQPHILINFMGINKTEHISKAKIVGCTWQILALSSAILVGIVGKLMLFPTLENRELVFIVMVKQIFPPFFAGIILCSIIAATVSTINIQSLISASLITDDLLIPILKQSPSEKTKLLLTRLAIFIIPSLSLIIAYHENYTVLDLVLYAWSGLGCTFGAIVVACLYSKTITRMGILAGLFSGAITAILWPLNGSIPVLIAGYIINFITIKTVSKITQ
ncbi:sodium/proline symporter [Candidatus Dependentiae bacterium]|nr:sodium/proline symporter [Candidatus Dependentiae bacterium]